MASKKRFSNLFLVVLMLSAALCGCTGDSFSNAVGHYEGFMLSWMPKNAPVPAQTSISGEIQANSNQQLTLKIQSEPSGLEIGFDLKTSNNDIQLSSPQDLPAALSLTKSADQCYSEAPASSNRLCFDGTQLTIELTSSRLGKIRIVLDRMNPAAGASPKPSPEAAQTYTIDNLTSRARTQSYDSRIKFESVVQAKLTSQAAYLNLLPHFNIGTGLSLVGMVTTSMMRAVGDLVPFFLPNRWFQAAALKDTSNAELDAYRIVQADAMNVVHGLALSVARDELALRTLELNRVRITQIRDELLAAEQNGSGNVQIGSSDDITSVLNSLMGSIDAMRETIREEKSALSQAAGFYSPAAVAAVAPVTLRPISGPIGGSPSDLENAALNRSLELLQIDELVQVAKNLKSASYFQWLDPAGNNQGSIGLGIVDYVEINSSTIRQLYDKKDKVQSQILVKVDDTLSRSGMISDQFQLAVGESRNAQNRIERLLMNLRTGIRFDMPSLVSALNDKTQSDVNQVNIQHAYLMLQDKMNFLTHSGEYAVLLGER